MTNSLVEINLAADSIRTPEQQHQARQQVESMRLLQAENQRSIDQLMAVIKLYFPDAIASATALLTAPCSVITVLGTPSSSIFKRL